MLYDNYIIHKVFEENEVDEINTLLKSDECEWVSGLKTGGEVRSKNNLELDSKSVEKHISKTICQKLNSNYDYVKFVVPYLHTPTIVSKMEVGGYYDVHMDNYTIGEYSTTVFISDDDSYEGGELCLMIENKELQFKLKRGFGITYKTGILHKVNRVTKGERLVCVLWNKSLFKDVRIRNIYSNIIDLKKFFKKNYYIDESLELAKKDPNLLLENILREIEVNFAREKK